MFHFCYQGNDHDCGFASLKMLLANLSKDKNYLYLRKDDNLKNGYSFSDLIKIAKRHNLLLEAYQVDFDALAKLKTPFIAMLNGNHSVVVRRIGKRFATYYDPGIGKVYISEEKFKKVFSGFVIEPVESNSIFECRDRKKAILPFYRHLIEYAFAVVVSASLLLGFYFLNDQSSFILLVIFLMVVVVSELVDNWYLIKNIKYFDNKYLHLYFARENNRDKEHYQDYLKYKESFFKSHKSIVVAFIFICVISTLLLLNDIKNVLILAILLMSRLIDLLAFDRKEDTTLKEIASLEDEAFCNEAVLIDNLKKASDKASGYASFVSSRKCVDTFLVAILAILMMMFNNVISVNYVLFHFGAYYVLSNSFGDMSLFLSNFKRLKRDTARFLDNCNL